MCDDVTHAVTDSVFTLCDDVTLTVFSLSASNYCGMAGNYGAIVVFDSGLFSLVQCSTKLNYHPTKLN